MMKRSADNFARSLDLPMQCPVPYEYAAKSNAQIGTEVRRSLSVAKELEVKSI
jgi:hypothetical protein